MPREIPYEDAAEKMKAVFREEEIVYLDFLLAEMENLGLIKRNRTSTEKSKLPTPIKEFERLVRWILYFLFGTHGYIPSLRSMVESEPNLSLFQFCLCIPIIWDASFEVSHLWYWKERRTGRLKSFSSTGNMTVVRQVIEEVIETRKHKYGSAEPMLRSIKVLLIKCEDVEVFKKKFREYSYILDS